ncbi:MAG: hypothetical protein ACOX3S_15465 [Anaerolineae bacterium]
MRLTNTRARLGAIGATGLILAWLFLVACQSAAPVEPTTDPTPERPTFTPAAGEPQPTPTLEATPMNTPTLAQSLSSAERRLLDLIRQDLSQRLQLKEPAVTIGAIEPCHLARHQPGLPTARLYVRSGAHAWLS